MKNKIFITILFVFTSLFVNAQSGWTKKINFAATARIAGNVSVSAKRISKSTPGLAGVAVRLIGSAAGAISSSAQKSNAAKRNKR